MNDKEKEKERLALQKVIESLAEDLAAAIDRVFGADGTGEPSKDPHVQTLIDRLNELKRRLGAESL